ncbi:hypothetical protein T484DRAFT_1804792 [Baffinella frigidus]|nr:hypothetical protein T484DRAFT_1804792 [Cryptophyta sp. CCMP2293]
MCRAEVYMLDLDTPGAKLTIIEPKNKEEDHLYKAEHWGDSLYILTNTDKCVNSKLVKAPISKPGRANWVEVLPKTTKLDYLVCFAGHIVINGRANGDKMLKIVDL